MSEKSGIRMKIKEKKKAWTLKNTYKNKKKKREKKKHRLP